MLVDGPGTYVEMASVLLQMTQADLLALIYQCMSRFVTSPIVEFSVHNN